MRNNQNTFDGDKTADTSLSKCNYYTQNSGFLQKFSNDISTIFYLYQITYYHGDSPDAVISNTKTQDLIFSLEIPHLINSVNNKEINDFNLFDGIKQTGNYETNGNSGSFSGGDTKKDTNRVVSWLPILKDYLSISTDGANS